MQNVEKSTSADEQDHGGGDQPKIENCLLFIFLFFSASTLRHVNSFLKNCQTTTRKQIVHCRCCLPTNNKNK